jgi:single-stranded-DNA-specific exonuclease
MKTYVLRKEIETDSLKNFDSFTRSLLLAREIKTAEDASAFLNPNYESHVHDPFLLKDMDRAVERVLKAISKNEKIAIYSDYDADGIPGAVVLHDFFVKAGYKNFVNYIPLRNEEGFGLNIDAVDELKSQDVKLLITIDCGITDIAEVDHAKKLGIDVIITDHHLPHAKVPKAFAVINPKQEGCDYPEKMLCGSGVIFKLVQALCRKLEINSGWEKWLLDMVGLATLSDMVPLLGENRVFARYGMIVLQKSPRVGLLKLFSKLKIDKKNATEDDIAFMVTPRINAASRMGIPIDAFKLLSTVDETEADLLVDHLNNKNDERKTLVAQMVKEIKNKIHKREGEEGKEMRQVLVLGNPNWKPSLLGLVANSFSEEHSRPVFVWGRSREPVNTEGKKIDNVIKGSCRSSGNIDIVALMEKAKDVFLEFGGHKGAGGFSLLQENVHTLEERLNEAFLSLSNENIVEDVVVDKKISLDEVNWDLYKVVEKFAPFGFGNPKPLFLLENIKPVQVKQFGKERNHLELTFKNSKDKNLSAMAFFADKNKYGVVVEEGVPLNLVATLEKSTFRSFPELRLRIVDIF